MQIICDRKPLASIVIDTYNYGHFIEEAIESVLSQSFPQQEMEIIVVDDGSTDDTAERIRKYKDKIKYIYKENGGQASAFNVGFENAQGEIITLLDSDDYWHPDKLKHVVGECEKSETVDVVSHYMNMVDNEHRIIGVFPDPKIQEQIVFEKYPLQNYLKGILQFSSPTSGITVKADCLKKIIPIPHDFRIAADLYMLMMLPLYGKEYSLIKMPLGSYRIHNNNFGCNEAHMWTRKTITVRHVSETIMLNSLAFKYVERSTKELGYDSNLLKKKFDSMEKK